MLLCSGATLLFPGLQDVFGGIGPLAHPWQLFTSAFEHGGPGFPLPVHLALNLVLLAKTGPPAERLLGPARFLVLTLVSILFYCLAQRATGVEANGSSVFIWSYGPVLFCALRLAGMDRGDGANQSEFRVTLWILWVAVPFGFAVFLALGGVDFWLALSLGNIFHFTATLAGFLGVWRWRQLIGRRLKEGDYPDLPGDRMATAGAWGVPLLMLSILVLAAAGLITV